MDIIVATPEKLLDFHRPQDISLKKMELNHQRSGSDTRHNFYLRGQKDHLKHTTKEKTYAVYKATSKQIIK